jgi:hypothetical protein
MLPSIDLRLQNLIKALREVIIPAIPARETLARDQATLVMAHLQVISLQWQSVAKYEAGSLDELCALIAELIEADLANIPNDLRTQAQSALAAAKSTDRLNHEAIGKSLLQLGTLADRIISRQDNDEPMSPSLKDAVLRYGARQSLRDRSWFAAHNLDPAPSEVLALESILQ